MDEQEIKAEVQKRYAAIANSGGCCSSSDCCSDTSAEAAPLVDYGVLGAEVVEGSNLGLGCGLPTLQAGIQAGETVLDLGSGAGVDVFLAARAVGPQGHAIGVDMTPEMIARAQKNALQSGFNNVEFRLGEIENLPVESNSVDLVLSNCVINLVPDKRRAFAEIHRVLKPGGRFSISDIVTFGEIPQSIRQDVAQWAGCIAGAMDQDEYLQVIRESGFRDVRILQSSTDAALQNADYGFASITLQAFKE